jgi:hypothetical protein
MSLSESAEHWAAGTVNEDFPPGTVPLEKCMLIILTIDSSIADKLAIVFDKKHGEIILQPRPTTDPNDPLNWPKWYAFCELPSLYYSQRSSTMVLIGHRYKAWNFTLVCLYTLLGACPGYNPYLRQHDAV